MEAVTGTAAVLLAHQGGWDETLMVLAPIVVVAALLHRANRRAKQHVAARGQAVQGPADPGGSGGSSPPSGTDPPPPDRE